MHLHIQLMTMFPADNKTKQIKVFCLVGIFAETNKF